MSKSRNKEFMDMATRRVVADYTQNEPNNLMERINLVNRACPGQSKQNIAYLLKSNEYDVNETVRRINEEGAKEMIGVWSKNTSKKNKRKKKKDDPAAQKEITPPHSSVPKPVNNLDARPSSDSKSSKPPQISNSISPKPYTAPLVGPPHPPLNSYTPSLPLDGYNNTYQHYPQPTDNHHLLTSSLPAPSTNIQFLLLQLQTHSSHLAQWQGMLQQRMDTSIQILQYVFQQLQTSLSERHQLLLSSIESGKWKAEEIFEQRKRLAQKLTAQAKSAPSEGVAEQIKQFLADKQNDQQLCDVYSLDIDHETMLNAVPSLGDIVNSIPQYSHWASNESANTHTQPQPQQVTYKPAVKQPVYQAPEFQAPPVQNFAPNSTPYQAPPVPQSHTHTEPEAEQPPEQLEVINLTSQVYEVTLTDHYSSDAKPVDLTSGAKQKTSKQELEAARVRMQGMLDKQGRSINVTDTWGKGAMVSVGGKRGGEKRGGRGGGRTGGKNTGVDKRGPPPRREGWNSQGDKWSGSKDNGPTFSAEYTNSNLEGDQAWDSHHEFVPNSSSDYVPSLVLTNNNFDNTPDETIPYDSVTSVASTEFKSTLLEDTSPEEFPPPQPQTQVNSFIPTQPEAGPTSTQSESDNSPGLGQEPASSVAWDDDTVISTDWGLDHEDP